MYEFYLGFGMSLIFAWYDLWVGFYVDYKKGFLYAFPIPMIGVKLPLKPWEYR